MKKHLNYYLLFLVIIMVTFGILFLSTLSATASMRIFNNTNYYLMHQLYLLLAGIILAVFAYKFPLNYFKKLAPILLFVNLILLVIVFLPNIGTKFWGAKRWINLGIATFQPSEILKITAILYLAALISNKLLEGRKGGWISAVKKGYHNVSHIFVPFLIFLAIISIFLILQPDISTLGIIGSTLVLMYFFSGTPVWNTVLIFLMAIGGFFALVKFKPYRLDRWLIFLHPETDPLGKGFQMKQSLIAIGSGGFFGKGWGMSSQKFGFLPQAMSDSIFAILGEETGIIGCSILVGLFIFFLWLGVKIAKSSNNKFSQLTALGITFWIIIQAILNITANLGIVPLAGIPLPFFSYGGSHLVAELIGVGILLNISKNG
ncbi:MAG: putative lipid II flippase FtsW [Candidatus Staskawiczbacteria bacterium]|nr:putative lipid II flippase FtsW [Candidatus Staskawiczbacteria bacterium]